MWFWKLFKNNKEVVVDRTSGSASQINNHMICNYRPGSRVFSRFSRDHIIVDKRSYGTYRATVVAGVITEVGFKASEYGGG